MEEYLILYGILLTSSLLYFVDKKAESQLFAIGAGIFFLILATFRHHVGADYESYIELYQRVLHGEPTDDLNVESGFVLLNKLAVFLGSERWVFFIVSTAILTNMYYTCRSFNLSFGVCFTVYMSIYGFSYNFNVIRHGLAISFIWSGFAAFYRHRYLAYIINILLAFAFHQFSLLGFSLPLLRKINLTKRIIPKVVVIATITVVSWNFAMNYILAMEGAFIQKAYYYLTDYYANEEGTYGITIGMIYDMLLAILALAVIYRDNDNPERESFRFFTPIMIIGIILAFALQAVSVLVERVAGMFLFSIVFLMPLYLKYLTGKINAMRQRLRPSMIILMFAMFTVICGGYFAKNLYLKKREGGYQFLPYRSTIGI